MTVITARVAIGWLARHYHYRSLFFLAYWLTLAVLWLVYSDAYTISLTWMMFFGFLIIIPLKSTLKDWWPIIIIPAAYAAMRGYSELLEATVNGANIIEWEKGIFGTLPTLQLQAWWHSGNQLLWFDYFLALFYYIFYPLPYAAALYLWFKKRSGFHFFSDGFVLLTAAGYITYALFPALPPWLASQRGMIPEFQRLLVDASQGLFGIELESVYGSVKANVIAAMPSLHFAWPWYTFLTLFYLLGKKALWLLIFPAGVGLTIIYFGEHYVVDLIAGLVYGSLSFSIIYLIWKLRKKSAA